MNKNKPTADDKYNTLIGHTGRASLFINFVCFYYKSSSWASSLYVTKKGMQTLSRGGVGATSVPRLSHICHTFLSEPHKNVRPSSFLFKRAFFCRFKTFFESHAELGQKIWKERCIIIIGLCFDFLIVIQSLMFK